MKRTPIQLAIDEYLRQLRQAYRRKMWDFV